MEIHFVTLHKVVKTMRSVIKAKGHSNKILECATIFWPGSVYFTVYLLEYRVKTTNK